MKRSTARVALPQSKLAGTVAGVAVCALDGTTPAPPKAAATKRRKPPKRMSRPLVMNDNVRIIAQVLEADRQRITAARSEEHTSELQSLMRISYAVFCLKKK